jgi:hypothetical protein
MKHRILQLDMQSTHVRDDQSKIRLRSVLWKCELQDQHISWNAPTFHERRKRPQLDSARSIYGRTALFRQMMIRRMSLRWEWLTLTNCSNHEIHTRIETALKTKKI